MKINLNAFFATLAVVTVAALLAGCASSGSQKGEKTAAQLDATAAEIELGKAQVQIALDTLNDLMKQPAEDLRPQYKTFSSAVSKVAATARRVEARARAMAAASQACTDKWDEQTANLANPDIRARSAARKAAVMTSLARVQAEYQQTKVSFNPLLADLQDIDQALSLDLTPAGVDSLAAEARKANVHGADVIKSLDALTTDFRDLAAKLSPLMPQPAGTAAK